MEDKIFWYLFVITLVIVSIVAVDSLIIVIFDVPKVFWINVHAFSLILIIAIYLLFYKILKKYE